jgi:hypothetical protein
MQRVALALIAAAVVVALTAFLVKSAADAVQKVGDSDAIAKGGMMQKAAFFLLLCLVLYVSVSGAS